MTDPTRRQIAMMADEVGITDHAAAVRLVRRAFEVFRPAPVPVLLTERLPGAEDCMANPRNGEGQWCWGWRREISNSAFSGRWRMVQRAFMVEDATHWLPAHALPLPSGEVQP